VKKELRARKLVSAGEGLEMSMDIRVYREKPLGKEAAKGATQALWKYLLASAQPRGAGL
jgi:hypothetical protein